jgi:hypothetical protein
MRVQKVRLFFIACSLRLRKQRVGVSFPFSLPGNHETLRSTSYLRSDVGLGITSHSPTDLRHTELDPMSLQAT